MTPKPRKPGPPVPFRDVRLPDLMLRVATAVMMFVAGTWWALGRTVAEKLVTALAMPASLVWLLLLVAVLAARRAGRRDLVLAAAIPWTALTLLGNGMVAGTLASSLEEPFRHIQPLESEPFDKIILLGGGTSVGGNGRIQANTAGDRILLTAQMYHAGLTETIICSGHRIVELNPDGSDPAQQAHEILMSLGVPEEAIQMQEGRNTSEELRQLANAVADSSPRLGLVTSAWHLPRAMRLASRQNLSVEPLPADFITGPPSHMTTGSIILSCVPQDGALWTNAKVLKEYLGMLVGR